MTSKMLYGEVDEEKPASLRNIKSFRLLKAKIDMRKK